MLISNWNAGEVTDRCVSSLLKFTDYPKDKIKIIIVDDSSTDNSPAFLRRKYSRMIDIIALKKNFGFIMANNIGIKYIMERYGPHFILLLNNDTQIVQRNWLTNLIEIAEQDDKVWVIGPRLIFPNRRVQWSGRTKENKTLPLIFQTISAGFNPGVGKMKKRRLTLALLEKLTRLVVHACSLKPKHLKE